MTQSTTAGDHSHTFPGSRAPYMRDSSPRLSREISSYHALLFSKTTTRENAPSPTRSHVTRRLINDLERASRAGDNIKEVTSVLCAYLEILNVLDKERAGAQQEGIHATEDWVGKVEVAKKQFAATQERGREDEEEPDHPAKHPSDLELIPFGRRDSIKLPDDLRVTHELQDNYGRDPAYAKTMLLRAPSRPELPSNLWENVLANSFIDFNQIFSQLSFPVERDRKIDGSGDWVYIWDKYEKAVLFAFPHRKLELQQYKNHIQELFLAMPETPINVLHYDHRVRARVADSDSLRLCDLSESSSDHLWFIICGDCYE